MIKYKDKKKKHKRKFYIPLKNIKFYVVIVSLLAIYALFLCSGFDVNMKCNKANNMCSISKSSLMEPVPVELGRFDTSSILDVYAKSRVVENGKVVYDILLYRGENIEQQFIDFGFNTLIKANTVKMKLVNYLETGTMQTLEVKKHCYFNDYFCF